MKLIVIGLNHRSAPIEVREVMAQSVSDVSGVYSQISHMADEAFLLSTCNRVELYAVLSSTEDELIGWMRGHYQTDSKSENDYLYVHHDKDAAKHLFRVISSLDSMIIGEDQIVSQVKSTYRVASEESRIGPILKRLIEKSFSVAKKVRTDTGISREGVSIGRAGVELARHILGTLTGKKALLIGAGQHGKLIARHLSSHNLEGLYISNRDFQRAEKLAKSLSASAIPLRQSLHYLEHVDIVLTSIGGSHPIISRDDLIEVRKKRRYRPLILIDLSIPRAIDPRAADLDDIFCFDVDDLVKVANEGQERRVIEAIKAEEIVTQESENCWRLLNSDELKKHIGQVFQHTLSVQENELHRLFEQNPEMSPELKKSLTIFSNSLVKKILHNPIQTAKKMAAEGENTGFETIIKSLLPDEPIL